MLVFSFLKDRCSRVDHAAHARRLRRREQRLLLGLGGPWLLPRRALRLEAHVLGPGAAQMLPRLRHQAAGQDDKPTEGGRAARVAVAAARVALGGHRLRAPPHLQRTTRGDGKKNAAPLRDTLPTWESKLCLLCTSLVYRCVQVRFSQSLDFRVNGSTKILSIRAFYNTTMDLQSRKGASARIMCRRQFLLAFGSFVYLHRYWVVVPCLVDTF